MSLTAYIVTVRPGTSDRYTDSIWLSEHSAGERAQQLVNEFIRRGRSGVVKSNLNEGWGAWVTTIQIEDAALALPSHKKKNLEEETPSTP